MTIKLELTDLPNGFAYTVNPYGDRTMYYLFRANRFIKVFNRFGDMLEFAMTH